MGIAVDVEVLHANLVACFLVVLALNQFLTSLVVRVLRIQQIIPLRTTCGLANFVLLSFDFFAAHSVFIVVFHEFPTFHVPVKLFLPSTL